MEVSLSISSREVELVQLPAEILTVAFSYMSPLEVLHLSSISSTARSLVVLHSKWQEMYFKR
jgi:hypothetical protein